MLVDYKVRIEPPKSRNGKRTLPLDDELGSALTELRKPQAEESATAGHANRAGLEDLGWYTAGDEYVVPDELGIRFTRRRTPTSSHACSGVPACPRSGCTTRATRP